jgi:hypothetical protein
MAIFYAAVDGDPLTGHSDSYVIARLGPHPATVQGEDGKHRSLVYIGDDAWCGACQSVGVIIGSAPVAEQRRMIDLIGGGRRQAVGEDQVLCKCATPPRIIATYGQRWRIVGEDTGGKAGLPVSLPSQSSSSSEIQYERWFYIWDSVTGKSMPNRDFIANVGGVRQTGRTDGDGYARIMTNGEQPVELHVVFNAPRRKLNPGGA